MKKKQLLTLGIAALLVLSGCGAKQHDDSQASSSSRTSTQQVTKVAYQNLGAKQRKQLRFRFQAKSDGGSDTLYNVNARITNKTKHAVTFNRAKFFIDRTADGDKIKSAATGRVTVQPGKHVDLKELFIDVNVSVFRSAGTFYYLNKHFPLAYTYHAHQGNGSTSNSLQDNEAKAVQSQAASNTSSSSSAVATSTSTTANSASANSGSTNTTTGTNSSNGSTGSTKSDGTTSNQTSGTNLTQAQLQAWAFKHTAANYNFNVTPNDFTFTFGTNSDGEATVTVAENHSSSNMQAHNADPNTNPTVASYTVNAQGELVNNYTQQVVASSYGN